MSCGDLHISKYEYVFSVDIAFILCNVLLQITNSSGWTSYHLVVQFMVEYMTSVTITVLNSLVPIVFKKLITYEDYPTAFSVNFTLARWVYVASVNFTLARWVYVAFVFITISMECVIAYDSTAIN